MPTTGNVWRNPEITSQHVDPQTSVALGQQAILEVKIVIFQGSPGPCSSWPIRAHAPARIWLIGAPPGPTILDVCCLNAGQEDRQRGPGLTP
jgi:hypothetical protein